MKAKLTKRAKPASCQGTEHSKHGLKLWAKVRGSTIALGPAMRPSSAWKCGTAEVFPITDPAYYKRLGYAAPPAGVTVFVCEHSIERFIKNKPNAKLERKKA